MCRKEAVKHFESFNQTAGGEDSREHNEMHLLVFRWSFKLLLCGHNDQNILIFYILYE